MLWREYRRAYRDLYRLCFGNLLAAARDLRRNPPKD